MSSVTISTTVCPEDQACSSTVGVNTRTFATPCGPERRRAAGATAPRRRGRRGRARAGPRARRGGSSGTGAPRRLRLPAPLAYACLGGAFDDLRPVHRPESESCTPRCDRFGAGLVACPSALTIPTRARSPRRCAAVSADGRSSHRVTLPHARPPTCRATDAGPLRRPRSTRVDASPDPRIRTESSIPHRVATSPADPPCCTRPSTGGDATVRRLTAEDIRYDADPDTVFAMICRHDFQERKCAASGAIEHEVEIETYDDGGATVTTHRDDAHRPGVPTSSGIDRRRPCESPRSTTGVHAGDDGAREGTAVVEIQGAPVRFTAVLRLRPTSGRRQRRARSTATSRPRSRWSAARSRSPPNRRSARRSGPSSATGKAWLAGADTVRPQADEPGCRRHGRRRLTSRAEAVQLVRAGQRLVRVAVVGRRHEGLLDRAGRRPAQQVLRGAGLVVGARGTGAAERLLPDDGTGRLVVDVEVARREPQHLHRLGDRRPVLGDDRHRSARTAPTDSSCAQHPVVLPVRDRRGRRGSARSTRW